ncbi:TPA: conjugal transfer protein TraD [Escherichia coli O25b:H4-ST131]|nr:conjugal transfer protein TraD [Escherichia coli O25b:H4-ST131]
MQDKWLAERIAYIRGLKAPNDHQRLLLLLNDKKDATPDDLRKLAALVKAEKAAEKAQRAKASVAKIVNAEKLAERKRRDRELYQSAGLLILAGLVDTKTGTPTRDRGELLGALVSLADSNVADEKRAEWKRKGDALLAAKGSK